MKMKMTLVRLIENKEPVMAMDQIDDLVYLGATVDMITDPGACEYLDIEIELPIQIFYPAPQKWGTLDEDEKYGVLSSPELGEDTVASIASAFKRKRGWIAFPQGFDYLSRDRECRLMEPDDLF